MQLATVNTIVLLQQATISGAVTVGLSGRNRERHSKKFATSLKYKKVRTKSRGATAPLCISKTTMPKQIQQPTWKKVPGANAERDEAKTGEEKFLRCLQTLQATVT